MSKTLFLTGIGGSIGIHTFCEIMENTDWDVVGVDSFRHKGWTDRVDRVLKDHPEWSTRLRLITHDLCVPFSERTIKKIGNVDYIISMASMSDVYDSIIHPVEFIRNNVDIAINMLEYARIVKPKVFIQISTDETLGPTETRHDKYTEWAPTLPSNPYAASKACQESIAISYWRTYDVPVIITNTMNNFGEMQQGSKFPVMVQKAVAEGKEITIHGEVGDIGSRSYIHSRNFSSALLFIINNLPPHMHVENTVDKPDRYHIAGDKQLDNLELALEIAKIMGKELKYKMVDAKVTRPGHDKHYGLDDSKLRSLGWKPPVSFEESLEKVIKWQMENEDWIK